MSSSGIQRWQRHWRSTRPSASPCSSTYSYFTAGYQSRLAWHLVAGGMFGTSTGIFLLGELQAILPMPEPYAAVMAAIGAIFTTFATVRWLREKNVASLTKITQLRHYCPTMAIAAISLIASSGTAITDAAASTRRPHPLILYVATITA